MQTNEMPFLDHLEELRWRIIKALVSVVFFTIIAFFFSDYFLNWLLQPSFEVDAQISLQVLKVQAVFIIKLEIALLVGVIISIPVILFQIWSFLSPGLKSSERKYIWPIIIFAMISFAIGAAFAYYLIIPYALKFFLELAPQNVTNNIAIDFYFGFLLRLLVVFGVVFELPVISIVLAKLGLITPAFLKKYRRHAIVLFFVAAALLTPPDPTTQVFLALPLILLYEFTIFILRFVTKKEKNEEA
ncbi:MAG: twin-arginine translocase subunit TatC [Calditrichaeota bacterium]|nr:MAG: twin-arginine translocase subunit TatC [Calditrichota bacterium]MBL1205473.1 twin-arginine translocase subunit TatC [Calditrichota bacterium]NOG45302.1 twin-arginine translocase subunit TatC [Calditrichota bacterium]